MPRLKVKGAEIFYRQRGKGRPLLLVHGWNSSSAIWSMNMSELSRSFRVIAPDLPGHGRSALLRNFHFTIEGLAGFLEDLRSALFLGEMDLLGHSMGGCVCLAYSLRHPQHVRNLVLVDTPWRRRSLSWPARLPLPVPILRTLLRLRGPRVNRFLFTRSLYRPDKVPSEVIEENVREAGYISLEAILLTTLMIRRLGFSHDELAPLRIPVLLLWGERDRAVRVTEGRRLREMLSSSRLVILPQAAHSPQLDHPDLFNQLVLDFLSQET